MTEKQLYERALNHLNEQYALVRYFVDSGKSKVAVGVYINIACYIQFMLAIGIVDYEEWVRMTDNLNLFFDAVFLD